MRQTSKKSSPLLNKLRSDLKRTRRERDEAKQATYDDIDLYISIEKELAEKESEAQSLRLRITELEAAQKKAEPAKETIRADEAEAEFRRLSTRIDDLTKRESALVQELSIEQQAMAKLRYKNAKLGELMADGMRQLAQMHDAIVLLNATRRKEHAVAAGEVAELRAKLDQAAQQMQNVAQSALEKSQNEGTSTLPDRLRDVAESCIRLSNCLRKDTGKNVISHHQPGELFMSARIF